MENTNLFPFFVLILFTTTTTTTTASHSTIPKDHNEPQQPPQPQPPPPQPLPQPPPEENEIYTGQEHEIAQEHDLDTGYEDEQMEEQGQEETQEQGEEDEEQEDEEEEEEEEEEQVGEEQEEQKEEEEQRKKQTGHNKTSSSSSFSSSSSSFATPALFKHYQMWMKRIKLSDYVNNRTSVEERERPSQTDVEKEEEYQTKPRVLEEEDLEKLVHATQENEIEDKYRLEKRSRALSKVILLGQKKTTLPKPERVDTSCKCGYYNSRQSKIVGGRETKEHHYPWMVSIQLSRRRRHFCGASIITADYLLTAAHCTDGLFPFEIVVRVGDHNLLTKDTSREKTIEVERIIQHPRYNVETTDSDIALLKLAETLVFTWRVSPICLTPPDLTYYNEEVTVIGWGRRFEDDHAKATILRHVDLKVLPMTKCRHNFLLESEEVTSKMLCAQGGTRDTCQGDSGGPLVWLDKTHDRYFAVGLTSWGVGCGLPKYPGVYTKITKFLPWIYEETKKSRYCSSYSPRASQKKIMMRRRGQGTRVNEVKGGKQTENGKWIYKAIGDKKKTTDRQGKMPTKGKKDRERFKRGRGRKNTKRMRNRMTKAGRGKRKKARKSGKVLVKDGRRKSKGKRGKRKYRLDARRKNKTRRKQRKKEEDSKRKDSIPEERNMKRQETK